jgi:hypothetical protein
MSNKMQLYTVYFIRKLLYIFSGGTITHHQQRKQLYLQLFVFLMMGGGTTQKHVEQFPDINKLCKVASCWIYIGIYLRCTNT